MLILKDCTALEELPQTIGKLSRLKNLDLQRCSTLKALPDSVGKLVELMQLNLWNCRTLERLPNTIGLLSKLKKLWLINCTELKFLPTILGNFKDWMNFGLMQLRCQDYHIHFHNCPTWKTCISTSVRRSKNCPPWVDLWSWSCSTWGLLECKHFQRILGTFKTLLNCIFMHAKTCKLFLKVLVPSNSKDSKWMTIISWKCSRKDLEDLNHLLTFILATIQFNRGDCLQILGALAHSHDFNYSTIIWSLFLRVSKNCKHWFTWRCIIVQTLWMFRVCHGTWSILT